MAKKPKKDRVEDAEIGNGTSGNTNSEGKIQDAELKPKQKPKEVKIRKFPDNLRRKIPDEIREGRDEIERQLKGVEGVLAAKNKGNTSRRVGLENVQAIYIGENFEDGKPTGELAVKVLVRKKVRDAKSIEDEAKIPPELKVQGKMVKTDIESSVGETPTTGCIPGEPPYNSDQSPTVNCGASIGHYDSRQTGTFGGLVIRSDNKICILSNNHVLANYNQASIGDIISHPGGCDLGSVQGMIIANLLDYVHLSPGQANEADAALAHTARAVVTQQYEVIDFNPEPLDAADVLGLTVVKEGRTTGYTKGTVEGVSGTRWADYPIGRLAFVNTMVIRGSFGPFSLGGDSGALVIDEVSGSPVGLLFGGDGQTFSFVNPIRRVMELLDIDRFVGEDEDLS